MTIFIDSTKKSNKRKETVFTHVLDRYMKLKVHKVKCTAIDKVLYLGYSKVYEKDMFLCWNDDDIDFKAIYLGVKGEEDYQCSH